MSHVCGKPTSEKVLNVSQKQPQCHPEKSPRTDPKYFHHCSKSQRQHKLKRLKTRKERSQMTGGWNQVRSCHRHCRCQSKRDVTHFQNCSHNSCHFISRKSTPVLSVVPTAQEPSIITDSRLIGRHGLFSHEIKSIDIERLLSEQSKREKRGEKVKKRNTESVHLSSSSHVSAARPGEDLFGADASGETSFINRTDSPEKIQDVFVETEDKNPQLKDHGSDVTPELTPQQQNNASAGSLKNNASPRHISHAVETFKNTNNVISEMDEEPHLTSDLEPRRKNQDSQTQTENCNPNSHLDSSSAASKTFEMKHKRQNSEKVSESVRALAARLCESLQFPLLKKRNLLEECREGLQKSLQESHGPWLQENLNVVRQGINKHPKSAMHEHRQALMEEDQLSLADKSVRLTENKHLNLQWISSPQTLRGLLSPQAFNSFLLNVSSYHLKERNLCLILSNFSLHL
ncbi:hypothetical protein OJAV_G00161850 [Oryzias javanicus]|uniref:Uncharacterized protein n=1 Tax=Oryzias javanicus TaxID=123683 RepID=A0A3S2MMS5_ORYJA|nr:hypothetical protein OJAV_G00161850 [Oryzias javanicus]